LRDDIAPGGFRPEIQGLRGLAVAFVVIFHIWPAALPGGYVGVDIFFVISGFLITGLLTRMALGENGISLVGFYTRRVRRLLPAAIVALLVTLAGTLLFVSDAWWEETARQVIASALYVQNWRLAEQAVDYLGA
jgi:peptidoglycan/LPS O-acetylase OafA/YrhL